MILNLNPELGISGAANQAQYTRNRLHITVVVLVPVIELDAEGYNGGLEIVRAILREGGGVT